MGSKQFMGDKFSYLSGVLGFIVFASACKFHSNESSVKQIFSDARRETISSTEVPYMLAVNSKCSGFIIDHEKRIAITATHCDVAKKSPICFGQEQLINFEEQKSVTCPKHGGYISEIIESSSHLDFDYVIFRYEFDNPVTSIGQSVRLNGERNLESLLNGKTELNMIGYPGDPDQQSRLTRSRCRVRTSTLHHDELGEFSFQVKKLYNDFQSKLSEKPDLLKDPDLNEAITICFQEALDKAHQYRPSFKTDCSVYGGNSGGPILIEASKVVIGMPSSYLLKPTMEQSDSEISCTDYFRPYGIKFPTPPSSDPKVAHQWNKLDRNSSDLSNFPTAIPMHLIVDHSEFLKNNPQYVMRTSSKSAGTDTVKSQETTHTDILSAGSPGCDYKDASKYEGYGYNQDQGKSCAPQSSQESSRGLGNILPPKSPGCDYSDAGKYDGYGWNSVQKKSCLPIVK